MPRCLTLSLVLSLVLLSGTASVQPVNTVANDNLPIKVDTQAIRPFTFNTQELEAYKNDKKFVYTEADLQNRLNWWQRLWVAFWRTIGRALDEPGVGELTMVIIRLLIVVVLVYAVLKLLGMDFKHFTTGATAAGLPYTEGDENIHVIDFDAEIAAAVQHNNYRLAVRLHYLESLKKLSDKGLIHWEQSKTNHDYLNELTDSEKKQGFGQLTQQFEYAWYGNFAVSEQRFSQISALFQNFNRAMK